VRRSLCPGGHGCVPIVLAIGPDKVHSRAMSEYDPKFIVRPSQIGSSWSVWLAGGTKASEEIADFRSLQAANDWIDTMSKDWLAARQAPPGG